MTEPGDEDRVSLAPLDAETALRALLAVDPDDEPAAPEDPAAPKKDPAHEGPGG